jgi:predicted metal-dependent phosphoesterase TrpH
VISDLHTHSHYSDGLLSPAQLAALTAERRVDLVALTDHDTIAGCDEMRAACAGHGLKFVAGVELSCTWRGQTLHVLGLAIDYSHEPLRRHLDGLLQLRRERMRMIAARLARRCGAEFGLLADEVAGTVPVPTRMHLARALVRAGHCEHTGFAFQDYLARGRPGYAPSHWPGLQATLQVIAAAGGQAALAHPQRYRLSSGALRGLVAEFAGQGGRALECSSGPTSPNDVARLAGLAATHGLLLSAGSDFHDPANPWNTPGRFAKLPAGAGLLASYLDRTHG